jgi:glycerol-3-phosphate acyltransferase PlsY
MTDFFFLFALPAIAYLLGSIPFGLLLTRTFCRTDIRKTGSGNIGATNVRRTAGNTLGLLTLAGDVLKGAVPVYLAAARVPPGGPGPDLYVAIVAFSAFCGHLWPVYLRFRNGGKGVATALGVMLAISPVAVLIALLVFAMVLCFSGRVSASSLAASASLPAIVWEATGSGVFTAMAALVGVLIFFRHGANIRRILEGEEPGIW